MADWFKFYENDLDETRFQYAIHQLVEVCPVWVGILSECCRHKSDTIRWGNNEIELFGFSQRLNVSVPKVNEAIKLLVDIDYISKGENTLKVLKWRDKQSDYCQRLKRATPNSVRTVSEQCSLRVEESRVDESRNTLALGGESNKPKETDEQWLAVLQTSLAYKPFDVQAEYSKAALWCSQNRRKLTRRFFLGWMNRKEKPLDAPVNGNGNGKPNGAQIIAWKDELDRVYRKMDKIRGQYGDHQAWEQKDKDRFAQLVKRKNELNPLIGVVE